MESYRIFPTMEGENRVRELRSDDTLYIEPETDVEAHVIRLLETEMRERGRNAIVITTPGTKIGHPYGRLFLQLGLHVRGYNEGEDWFREHPNDVRYFWVTAKTSDGRLLAVRWPSGVEG